MAAHRRPAFPGSGWALQRAPRGIGGVPTGKPRSDQAASRLLTSVLFIYLFIYYYAVMSLNFDC